MNRVGLDAIDIQEIARVTARDERTVRRVLAGEADERRKSTAQIRRAIDELLTRRADEQLK